MNASSTFKRSLVLAGGGIRLAYHAGVLMALEEAEINFTHIDGTSGGIFGTAMLASGISPAEAAVRWRKLNLEGFMSALPLTDYRSQHSLPAMGSADGIRKKIFPSLGIDIKKINANTTFDATFNVCNFSTKSVESIPHPVVTEDHLVAGISLPVFMPAVNIGGVLYTDAVWIKDANLTEAINRGAAEIWLVWCIGNTPDYLNGFFNQYVHMIEMSADGGLILELEWIKQQNAVRAGKDLPPVILHMIKPAYPLPLDPDFLFGKINADTLISMGYADAKEYLADKVPLNLQEPYKAAIMKSAGTTLHFRQQFKGTILLGDQSCALEIRLAFFVHETAGDCVWRQYASVDINNNEVVPGYKNTVTVGQGALNTFFIFNFKGCLYSVQVKMHLRAATDLLIGLDIKSARVTIGAEDKKENEAVFFQPAKNRINNAFHLNIKTGTGWWGKFQSKKRLLNTVFK